LQNTGLFYRALLQKRPKFLSILLIVATPYIHLTKSPVCTQEICAPRVHARVPVCVCRNIHLTKSTISTQDSPQVAQVHSKEPGIYSKEPYMHFKEPYIHFKKPYIHSREPTSRPSTLERAQNSLKRALYTLKRALDTLKRLVHLEYMHVRLCVRVH